MKLYIKNDYNSKEENSESLLKKVLALYMNEKTTSASFDAEDFCIQRTAMGKPYIASVARKERHFPYFSVSHTGNVWACLVAECQIGLDIQIEKANVKFEAISKRFFEEREKEYIVTNGIGGFYNVWTAREAYAKYTGEGFFGKSLKEFSLCDVLEDEGNRQDVNIQFVRFPGQYLDEKLCCAICLPHVAYLEGCADDIGNVKSVGKNSYAIDELKIIHI